MEVQFANVPFILFILVTCSFLSNFISNISEQLVNIKPISLTFKKLILVKSIDFNLVQLSKVWKKLSILLIFCSGNMIVSRLEQE